MKLTNITKSQQLHEVYTEDMQSKFYDYIEGVGIVRRKWCTKLLVFNREGKPMHTEKWFITYMDNELIYNTKGDWVNLDMFDKNESYCDKILLFEEKTNEL